MTEEIPLTKVDTVIFNCLTCNSVTKCPVDKIPEFLHAPCPMCKRKSLQLDLGIDAPIIDTSGRLVPNIMAEYLMRKFQFVNIMEEDTLYYFDGVRFIAKGREIVQSECARIADFACSSHLVNETINHIKYKTHTKIGYFNTAIVENDNGIFLNVKNGVLELKSKTLGPHSAEYRFTKVVPVTFSPNASFDEYLQYLLSMMSDNLPGLLNLIEAGAYMFMPKLYLGKVTLLEGQGGEGKGTWLKINKTLLGRENCSGLTIQELSSDRFASADLYLRMANFATEGKAARIDDSSIIKACTTLDASLSAQFKGKPRFDFDPTAKFYISTNRIPKSEDVSDGFYDRFLIIQFKRRFRDTKEEKPDLEAKFTTDESLSGIFNLYLEVLPWLLERKKYTFAPSLEETARLYTTKSSSIQAWIRECVVAESNVTEEMQLENDVIIPVILGDDNMINYIPKDKMWNHYLKFCASRPNTKVESETLFWISVKGLSFYEESRAKIEGKQTYCVAGMRLKTISEVRETPKPTLEEMTNLFPKYPVFRLLAGVAGVFPQSETVQNKGDIIKGELNIPQQPQQPDQDIIRNCPTAQSSQKQEKVQTEGVVGSPFAQPPSTDQAKTQIPFELGERCPPSTPPAWSGSTGGAVQKQDALSSGELPRTAPPMADENPVKELTQKFMDNPSGIKFGHFPQFEFAPEKYKTILRNFATFGSIENTTRSMIDWKATSVFRAENLQPAEDPYADM